MKIIKGIIILNIVLNHSLLIADINKKYECLSHDNEPLSVSQNKLKNYFSPKVSEMVTIDEKEMQEHFKDKNLFIPNIKGEISVFPPPKSCFKITRRDDIPDDVICYPEKRNLSFTMSDLSSDGFLKWKVSTCKDDAGTTISWPSPYTWGKMKKTSLKTTRVEKVGIYSCKFIVSKKTKARKVSLELMNGDQWQVNFPKVDTLVRPIPPDMVNLYIGKISTGSVFVELAVDPNTSSTLESQAPAGQDSIKVWRKQYKGSTPWDWRLHPRNSYTMSASHFIAGQSTPFLSKGECRYKYSDKKGPYTSLLECFDVPGYRWLYLPLSCLKKNTFEVGFKND